MLVEGERGGLKAPALAGGLVVLHKDNDHQLEGQGVYLDHALHKTVPAENSLQVQPLDRHNYR